MSVLKNSLKYLSRLFVIMLINILPLAGPSKTVFAQDAIKVAVATNFIRTADELVDSFAKETDITVIRSTGATGMLYSQIVNGAPYDLFLSADTMRPELLHQKGLCDEPFTYAGGRVVLWSARTDLDESENWQKVIMRPDIDRVAIANPATAPYGSAAVAAMERAGIREIMKPRLVYGQNVGQTFQYGWQGAADMAFVSLSFALSEQGRLGKTWLLPEADPVIQKGCLLADSKNKESVHELIAFFRTGRARTILAEFGYN